MLFANPINTGKTHLAISLGIEAARQRRRVAFWRAADLVRTLIEARDAKELGRLWGPIGSSVGSCGKLVVMMKAAKDGPSDDFD